MKVKIQDARIAFPSLFKEDKFGNYSARFIFPNDSGAHKVIKEALEAAGKDKFATKWPTIKKMLVTNNKLGIHDGDLLAEERPEYEGSSYITAKNKMRPVVKDRKAETVFEDGLVYGGCRADAILDVYASTHPTGGPYVSIKLLGVQFRADDEAFSSGSRVEDQDFETIAEGADAEDL